MIMKKDDEKDKEYEEIEEKLLEEVEKSKEHPMEMSGKGVFRLKEIIDSKGKDSQ